jgi:hypothetical protein
MRRSGADACSHGITRDGGISAIGPPADDDHSMVIAKALSVIGPNRRRGRRLAIWKAGTAL